MRLLLAIIVTIFPMFVSANSIPPKGEIWLNDVPVESLQTALANAEDYSVISLGSGDFEQAGIINKNNIRIEGTSKTRIHTKTVQGKAAIVVKGNNTVIKNIECFGISVSAKNGACVRMEGQNLTLDGVYFHDSEQGLLTNSNPGNVNIISSRFERLGKSGRAHGIYVGGGKLFVKHSKFLSSKDQGHEIKSRALETRIENTVLASLDGDDSRLVDIPNGGILIIQDSVLEKGPNSLNSNLIGYGQEGIKHPVNSVTLIGNIFLLEREKGNKVLALKNNKVKVRVTQNAFIGRMGRDNFDQSNYYFEDRKSAGLGAYPELPELTK